MDQCAPRCTKIHQNLNRLTKYPKSAKIYQTVRNGMSKSEKWTNMYPKCSKISRKHPYTRKCSKYEKFSKCIKTHQTYICAPWYTKNLRNVPKKVQNVSNHKIFWNVVKCSKMVEMYPKHVKVYWTTWNVGTCNINKNLVNLLNCK